MYLNKLLSYNSGCGDVVDSAVAVAFICDGYGFKSSLTRYLHKGNLHWEGLVCECMGVYTGIKAFLFHHKN